MHRIDLTNIKNIIFDLGIVLLDLNFQKAKDEFKRMGLPNFEKVYSSFHANPFFHDYETGKISDKDFIEGLKKLLPKPVDSQKIISVWNDIIEGFPMEKLAFLEKISSQYDIYLLSNTNSLHAKKYEANFKKHTGLSIHSVFKKVYYSHDIAFRKPDKRAFLLILEENGLNAGETLFIDDVTENLTPAKGLNINTFHYKEGDNLFSIFGLNDNK